MKYSSQTVTPKNTKKNTKQNSTFREFISGDFLLKETTLKLWPFFLLFFVLSLVAIMNQKSIKNKKNKIDKKEIEYKIILNELKKNNQFIPYDQLYIIQEQAKLMGFVKNTPNTFKLTIQSTDSK
ncbi:MAG TPA: FtsL-like putative cell division protein [Bacteroidales bacterium]|nr:FtsL-like putative cell division protein [Bacteroidales bacterium]